MLLPSTVHVAFPRLIYRTCLQGVVRITLAKILSFLKVWIYDMWYMVIVANSASRVHY